MSFMNKPISAKNLHVLLRLPDAFPEGFQKNNWRGKNVKLVLLFFLFFSNNSFAATFVAYNTGNWSSRSTWVTTKTGTVTVASGATAVTGTGTAFTTELQVGDKIYNSSFSVIGTVASITSNTSLTLSAGATSGLTGSVLYSHGIPTLADDIQIGYVNLSVVVTLTVNGDYSCNSMYFVQNGGVTYTVDIPTSNSLSVTGTVYLVAANNNGNTHTLNVSGTLNAAGLYLQGGTNNTQTKFSQLAIQNGGTANITGDIYIHNISVASKITVSSVGTGRLNLGGNFISTAGSLNSGTPYTAVPTITPSTTILAGTNSFASTSVLSFNGTNKLQVVPISATATYGNVYFNNTGNNLATLNGNITATNVLGDVIVQSGTFTTQGASSSTTLNAASTSFTLTGNAGKIFRVENGAFFRISGTNSFPSSFGSVILQPTSTVDYIGTTQTISPQNFGNLNVSAGASAGRVISLSSTGTIGVYSNFNPSPTNNVYTITGSTISFNGNQSQSIASGLSTYNNLTINNVSAEVTLNSSITVNGTLSFTSGKLSLGNNNLTIASSGSISGASNTSYIIAIGSGTLTQQVPAAGSKIFPVGIATHYTPATFALTAGSTTDNISLRMLSSVYGQGETGGTASINAVNATWIITESVAGGSNATITTQWPSGLELPGFNRSLCRVAHYTSGTWDYGTSDIAATGSDPYLASRSGFTSFSPFAVTSSSFVVPVTWLSFNGRNENNNNHLQWETASEMNNKYFVVEASANGLVFAEVGRVLGIVNSNIIHKYEFIHENAGNTNYYRIKQVDIDGRFSFSTIIKIQRNSFRKGPVVSPNPVSGLASVSIQSELFEEVNLIITDMGGRIVHQKHLFLQKGNNFFSLDLRNQVAGLYTIQIIAKKGIEYNSKILLLNQ
jgi:fibronectin-binding autotransporter adhesin